MPASKSSSKGWLALILFVAAGLLVYRLRPQPVPISSEAVRRPVLAILIFDNLNENSELDFLGNALTRETIDKLGQVSAGRFDVIAHDSVVAYRKTRKSLQQIGRELDVDYVVEGGARKDGDRLQLKAQFTRVSDRSKLWTEDYDRPMADAFQIQNLLIERIVAALGLTIDPATIAEINRAATQNASARESYLRGVDQCAVGDAKGLKNCIASFESALRDDPGYARAHVALAAAQLRDGRNPDVAEQHVRQALSVTDWIPQAHLLLGEINGDESEFRKAIAQDPIDAAACLAYASFLLGKGRLPEATIQVQRAIELDPSSVAATVMSGRIAIAAKFYDRGIAQLEKAVGMDRNNPDIRFRLAEGYLARNNLNDAIREFQRAVSFGPGIPEYIAALGQAYAKARRYEDAKAQLVRLQQLSRTRHVSPELIDNLSKNINPS